jgi:RNA-directed DNA polymerase
MGFLRQIRDELITGTYRPMRVRKREIPKDGVKKVRVLSIPAIRDRVVQGALKLILEPILEADFQEGSYRYRPSWTAHEAIDRGAHAIVEEKTRIIDLDLRAYFDHVQHYVLLEKVARRVQDEEILHLLKMTLKANRYKRRSARRGDIAAAQQRLPHGGGSDAGKGDPDHALREIHGCPIRTFCGRPGDLD